MAKANMLLPSDPIARLKALAAAKANAPKTPKGPQLETWHPIATVLDIVRDIFRIVVVQGMNTTFDDAGKPSEDYGNVTAMLKIFDNPQATGRPLLAMYGKKIATYEALFNLGSLITPQDYAALDAAKAVEAQAKANAATLRASAVPVYK